MDPRAQRLPRPAPACARASLLTLFLLGASACATSGSKPDPRLEQEAASFVYVAPPAKVIGEARTLLEADGYKVQTNPGSPNVISTPWKEVYASEEMGTQVRRYLVMGKDVGQGRYIVRIFNITYTTVGTVDAHPSLGNHSYARGGGGSGGSRAPFMVKGQGAAAAKGWYQRDLEMEWHLLQRLEPQLALELERGVKKDPDAAVASAARAR